MAGMELVNFAGGPIYKIDIRPDNLQNLYWRTRDEGLIRIGDMPDAHLRNIALMLMGMGYQTWSGPDEIKILWLTAFRLEWERRRKHNISIPRSGESV